MAFGFAAGPGSLGPWSYARAFRRRFVPGKRKRPSTSGGGVNGWVWVISSSSPEASAGGRLFDLSAHERSSPPDWRRGVCGGRLEGRSDVHFTPEPPLLFVSGFAWAIAPERGSVRRRKFRRQLTYFGLELSMMSPDSRLKIYDATLFFPVLPAVWTTACSQASSESPFPCPGGLHLV